MEADQIWSEFLKTGDPERYLRYARAKRKGEKAKANSSPPAEREN